MTTRFRLRSFVVLLAIGAVMTAVCGYRAIAATGNASKHQEKRMNKHASGKLKLQELRIVDESGRVCIVLSAHSGVPSIQLLGSDGSALLSASLSKDGFGAVKIENPNTSGSVAAIEVDDKGAHVKFDRPGGASSYLFLNNWRIRCGLYRHSRKTATESACSRKWDR